MEATIDQKFIEYVVRSLVSKPDAVIVERKIDEKGVLLTLTVDPEDLGRVIGKRGATAQSLRTLLRALGTKQEARFNLKIVDNGVPREERENNRQDDADSAPRSKTSSSSSASSSEGSAWSSSPTDSNDSNDDSDSDDSDSSSANSSAGSSAAQDAANDSGEEESAIERTRRELMDLDDLDV